jgi:hypothetical protein
MQKSKNWAWGFLIILVSGIICFALSMSNPRLDQMELGALLNLGLPVISTIIGILIFLVVGWALKKESWLTVSSIISAINILLGIGLHRNG